MRRSLHPTLLLVAALAGGTFAGAQSDPLASRGGDLLGAASRGSLRSVLRPAQDLRLSSRAAGVVEKFHLEEGEVVQAGGPILSLDSEQEQAELQQAQALLQGAKSELARAEAELTRIAPLSEENIYSEKQLVEVRTEVELSRSKVQQAEAAIALAQARLANRTIVSPIEGIFLKTNKSVGEAVERFETVARVVDVSSLEMVVYCDSQYFSVFKLTDMVRVRVLKGAEEQPIVEAKIVHIDPIIDPSSGTFRIKLQLPRSAHAAPGYAAVMLPPPQVTIVTRS